MVHRIMHSWTEDQISDFMGQLADSGLSEEEGQAPQGLGAMSCLNGTGKLQPGSPSYLSQPMSAL